MTQSLCKFPASRPVARLATIVLAFGGLVSAVQAEVLVYEPFQYTAGTGLNGQYPAGTAAFGFAPSASWSASTNGGTFTVTSGKLPYVSGPPSTAIFDGTVTSLVSYTGNYAGSNAINNSPDHMCASIDLAPSVTSSFTDNSTTWMSCVFAADHYRWLDFSFALGSGVVDIGGSYGRGENATGPALGIGCNTYNNRDAVNFAATVWNNTASSTDTGTAIKRDNSAQILIAKINWKPNGTPDEVRVAAFSEGTTLTETAFNNAAVLKTIDFNQSTFTKLSVAGARYSIDELRVATTFNTVIGGVDAAAVGSFWGPVEGGGGSGTWTTTSKVWATSSGQLGTLDQSTTDALTFTAASGTVAIDGKVTANKGLKFLYDGYHVVPLDPYTSTPQLELAGGDALTNSITVGSNMTATISAEVIANNGMTKLGDGTLVLSGANSNLAGITINAGKLQVASLASLGTGNITFQDGTLQYPTGSGGTSGVDFSGKIPTVASGKVVKIDTNNNDVTFASNIAGQGGLTKSGLGKLTLSVANDYTGPTTVSAGTLEVNAGTVATLNVPAGQASLNSPATATIANVSGSGALAIASSVGTLNVSGGTMALGGMVNALNLNGGATSVGAGAQVATIVAASGTMDASVQALNVTGTANLSGAGAVKVTTSGPSFTLGGTNVVNPDTSNHRTITVGGGTLTLGAGEGNVMIGGSSTSTGSATVNLDGTYTLTGTNLPDFDYCGEDGKGYFHYMTLPVGDFDLKVKISRDSGGWTKAGLMVRDSLAPSGQWSEVYQSANATFALRNMYWRGNEVPPPDPPVNGFYNGIRPRNSNPSTPADQTDYFELKRTGATLSAYYGNNNLPNEWVLMTDPDYNTPPLDISGWDTSNMYLGFALASGNLGTTFEILPGSYFPLPDWSLNDLTVTASTTVATPAGNVTLGNLSLSGASTALSFSGATSVSLEKITAASTSSIEAGVPIKIRSGLGGLSEIGVDTSAVLTLYAATTVTGALTKTGAGTLALGGAVTQSGSRSVNVTNGSLELTGAGVLPANSVVALGNGATSGRLALKGHDQTLAWLETAGTGTANQLVNDSATPVTLTIQQNETEDDIYSGNLGAASDDENRFGLQKTGTGKLVLSGTNTYTGGTTVTGGTLVIASATALPAGKSLSIGSGGTLILGGGMALGTAANAAEPVPEPGTLALLVIAALAGLFAWRRRQS